MRHRLQLGLDAAELTPSPQEKTLSLPPRIRSWHEMGGRLACRHCHHHRTRRPHKRGPGRRTRLGWLPGRYLVRLDPNNAAPLCATTTTVVALASWPPLSRPLDTFRTGRVSASYRAPVQRKAITVRPHSINLAATIKPKTVTRTCSVLVLSASLAFIASAIVLSKHVRRASEHCKRCKHSIA